MLMATLCQLQHGTCKTLGNIKLMLYWSNGLLPPWVVVYWQDSNVFGNLIEEAISIIIILFIENLFIIFLVFQYSFHF